MKRSRNNYWRVGYERRALRAVKQRMMKVKILEMGEEEERALIEWEVARLEKLETRKRVRELIKKVDAETVEVLMQNNSPASEKEKWWKNLPRKLARMFFPSLN